MGIMKLLAYVPHLTPRIKYIFYFMFRDVLKTDIEFSSNLAEFKRSPLAKISYSNQSVADEIHFRNVDLLLSHKIIRTTFKTTAFGDTIVPFAISGGALPFDPFAAAFYFVSRYEEYLHYIPDDEGHYPAELSLQSRLKILQIPVVDAWALIIKNLLLKKYPDLHFGKKSFNFIPLTCMYPGGTNARGLIHSAKSIYNKTRVLFTRKAVPENESTEIHQYLKSLQDKFKVNGLFFYLLPDEDGEVDGQIDLPKSYLQLLKEGTNKDYRMGYKKTAGFRAGTCSPFYWYDLQLEKSTHLLVHPIAINDLSLNADKLTRTDSILEKWKNMVDTVKLLNGQFYILWHQDNLLNTGKGKTARKLYAKMLSNFLSLPNDLRPE
ncbi:DUF7033 domain-containing protein [Pedobacter immunditicola]|uniref:DUF7033 domain-containing protein n=1 Tax=Pedobacter immunditicola TaxID=3133440 RepID=UPI0030AD37BE